MPTPKEKKGFAILERHMQTILTFVITALIAWVGTSISNQRLEIALLQQSVDTLQTQVMKFTELPRFTEKDFHTEMRSYDAKLLLMDRDLKRDDGRIDNMLGRVRKLEILYNTQHKKL